MKTPNQQQVWNNIAKKWQAYRHIPERRVIEFLKGKKGKIIDLGCGSGRNFIKSKNLEFYGVDFSEKLLDYANKKKIAKELIHSQITKLPYTSNFFDLAICIAVLHCLTPLQRQKALKELYRVLKPKTEALISVWSKKQKRLKNKGKTCLIPWTVDGKKQKRYTYIFTQIELENELKKAGFKIKNSWEDKNINIIVEKA